MKSIFFLLALASAVLLATPAVQAQKSYQPEDIIFSAGEYHLRYKHLLAYVDMEMEGEDPALLNDAAHMQELTKECLEEFAEAPAEVLRDLDQHYQAMQMGMGGLTGQQNRMTQQQQGQSLSNTHQGSNADGGQSLPGSNAAPTSAAGQWKQMLSGSVLSNSATHSSDGLFTQSGNYLHLCPNGTFLIYESSAGGGNGIHAPNQVQLAGSGQWNITEQNGVVYFQFGMQGAQQALPIGVLNNKVVIQGLGQFSYQQGAARCY